MSAMTLQDEANVKLMDVKNNAAHIKRSQKAILGG